MASCTRSSTRAWLPQSAKAYRRTEGRCEINCAATALETGAFETGLFMRETASRRGLPHQVGAGYAARRAMRAGDGEGYPGIAAFAGDEPSSSAGRERRAATQPFEIPHVEHALMAHGIGSHRI